MAKYLDLTGLQTFFDKIKATFQTLANLTTNIRGASSASDTLYPSEKAVATSMAYNIEQATQKDDAPTKDSTKLLSSGTIYEQLQVLVQAANELNVNIEAILNIENYGDLKAESISTMEIPKIGDDPMLLVGDGAPSIEPAFAGQGYIDSTNQEIYIATGKDSVSYWKKIAQPTGTITSADVEEIYNGINLSKIAENEGDTRGLTQSSVDEATAGLNEEELNALNNSDGASEVPEVIDEDATEDESEEDPSDMR